MKKIIFGAVIAVVVGSAIGFISTKSNQGPLPDNKGSGLEYSDSGANVKDPTSGHSTAVPNSSTTAPVVDSPKPRAYNPNTQTRAVAAIATQQQIGFTTAIERLLSPQSTHAQRQEAWQQLRDSGQLDATIAELEKRSTENPQASEPMAALGQAYLFKAGTIRDMREQGILAMQADKTFDAALQLDRSNWDARFMKAVAMSHWPPQLGKGQEVIDHFTQLITQQETQTPQPHFAQSYAWLGDQYEKQGRNDYARAAWERGSALFPNDESLSKRLSKPFVNTDGKDSTISTGAP